VNVNLNQVVEFEQIDVTMVSFRFRFLPLIRPTQDSYIINFFPHFFLVSWHCEIRIESEDLSGLILWVGFFSGKDYGFREPCHFASVSNVLEPGG